MGEQDLKDELASAATPADFLAQAWEQSTKNAVARGVMAGMRPKNFLGLSTRETKREHLASLQERHSNTSTCPKCGGDLVLRTIKIGEKAGQQFYGCAKFPACRFIRAGD